MTGLRIVFAAHTAELGIFTVGSHHLSRGLAARGHTVVHIASPLTAMHGVKVRDEQVRARFAAARAGLVRESAQYATLVPLLAAPVPPAALISSARWWRSEVGSGLRDARAFLGGRVDLIILDQPMMCTLAEHLDAAAVIVRSTDVVTEAQKQRGFARAVATASGLIGTSPQALEQLVGFDDRQLPTELIANGVDFERFAAHDVPWSQRSGCVYVGALDERFDWDFVRTAARGLPTERFDVYGPAEGTVEDLPANVRLCGAVPYAQVPEILSRYRVGLLPLVDSAANHGRSPMKLYEYLAAGLAVVASAADSLPTDLQGSHLVPMGATPAPALTAALAHEPGGAARAAAQAMGWPARLDLLEEFIRDCR